MSIPQQPGGPGGPGQPYQPQGGDQSGPLEWIELARQRESAGDMRGALEAYRRAYALSPPNSPTAQQLASIIQGYEAIDRSQAPTMAYPTYPTMPGPVPSTYPPTQAYPVQPSPQYADESAQLAGWFDLGWRAYQSGDLLQARELLGAVEARSPGYMVNGVSAASLLAEIDRALAQQGGRTQVQMAARSGGSRRGLLTILLVLLFVGLALVLGLLIVPDGGPLHGVFFGKQATATPTATLTPPTSTRAPQAGGTRTAVASPTRRATRTPRPSATPPGTPSAGATSTTPPTDTAVPSDTPVPGDTPAPSQTPVPTQTPAAQFGQVGIIAPQSISASGAAPPAKDSAGNVTTYDPQNAIDGVADTAWRVAGDGTNQFLLLQFNKPTRIDQFGIIPGYAKVDPVTHVDRFTQNRRVARVRLEFDNGTSREVSFQDHPTLQVMPLNPSVVTRTLRIVILQTLPPSSPDPRDFTPISEIQVIGAEQLP